MIKNFIKKNNIEFEEEASLKKYNTYRLDIKSKYIVFPKTKEELKSVIKYLQKNEEKYLVLGNGSNIIFSDDYYDGTIILLHRMNNVKIEGQYIEVEAGYSLQKLAIETSNLGLEGLEFATGIPGLIGASIAMNAGAYNESLSQVVISVTVLNKECEFVTMTKEELNFNYRDSFFKANKNYYIVSATLKLTQGDRQEILERISKRRVKRIETQPLDMPSAGSVFRNPPGMHAGELIEKCGLKGISIGGAKISEKHANFIINTGNATGSEIIQLIEKTKEKVKEEYNVELILEQIIIE